MDVEQLEQLALIQLPKSAFNGRGCTFIRTKNGNGMRVLFALNKKKRETARVRTQEPLMETAKMGTLAPLKQTARERNPRTFTEPVERWRIQKKRKEKTWKKKKKKKIRRKKCTSSILIAKRKEEEKEKKSRKSDKRTRTRKSWGSQEDRSFFWCLWRMVGFVTLLQPKDCRKGRRQWKGGSRDFK